MLKLTGVVVKYGSVTAVDIPGPLNIEQGTWLESSARMVRGNLRC